MIGAPLIQFRDISMKKCCRCNEIKDYSEFHKNSTKADGYAYQCKPCRKSIKAESYQKNKEIYKNTNKAYREKNKGLKNSWTAKRRANCLKATPKWANKELIASYYNVCAFFNEINGYTKYHVDHIIPLQGKLVSGLHVENNLQVILAEENISKSNKYTVSGY